jgi:lactoylglutathione lyase
MHLMKLPIALLALALFIAGGAAQTGTVVATPLPPQPPTLPPSPVSADNPLGLTVDHVTIWVADIDAETKWYEDVLGFKEVQRRSLQENQFRSLRIPGVYRIDLTWWKGSTRHVDAKDAAMEQGYRHIVFKTQDLKAALDKLTKKNANVRAQRDKNGNLTNVLVLDPEGNEIELQQY